MKKILVIGFLVLSLLTNVWAADYPSKPYTFAQREIISSSKINADYDTLFNAWSDGDKDINLKELYTRGVKLIDSNRNISAETLQTTGNFTIKGSGSIVGTLSVSGNIDTTGNALVKGSLNVTGNSFMEGNLTVSGNLSYGGSVDLTTNSLAFTSGQEPSENVWIELVYLDSAEDRTPEVGRLDTSKMEYIAFSSGTINAVHFQAQVPQWVSSTITPSLVMIMTVSANNSTATVSTTVTYNAVASGEDGNAAGTAYTTTFIPALNAGIIGTAYIALAPVTPLDSLQIQFQRNATDGYSDDIQVLQFGIMYKRRKL